jgi:hypothetical protein
MTKMAMCLLVATAVVSVPAAWSQQTELSIRGVIERNASGFYVDSDRDYAIRNFTVLLDGSGKRMSYSDLSTGRFATVLSATNGEMGQAPIATRLIVYEPE